MVQIAAIRPVQPHVPRGTVAVIPDGPFRYPHTGPFIAFVLLHNEKLSTEGQAVLSGQTVVTLRKVDNSGQFLLIVLDPVLPASVNGY